MSPDFAYGNEPRTEEIDLHQRYLTLYGQFEAAEEDGDRQEVKRLKPLVETARKRWLKMNRRVVRGV